MLSGVAFSSPFGTHGLRRLKQKLRTCTYAEAALPSNTTLGSFQLLTRTDCSSPALPSRRAAVQCALQGVTSGVAVVRLSASSGGAYSAFSATSSRPSLGIHLVLGFHSSSSVPPPSLIPAAAASPSSAVASAAGQFPTGAWSGSGSDNSADKYARGSIRKTVFRNIDPVVVTASSALTSSDGAPPDVTSSATETEITLCDCEGTCSSMNEGTVGGVPLLVVVGVVLLDDPQMADGAACSSSSNAADAEVVDGVPQRRPARVLLAQRPAGKSNTGLWEFPGGKVDSGETPEAALVRELHEELDISVKTTDLRPLTFASHTYPSFHLLMPLYVCRHWSGQACGAEGQAVVWATAEELTSYNLTPADIPLVPAVLAAMRNDRSPPQSPKS